jgi:hypothetical protein
MRAVTLFGLAFMMLVLSGCTEMRVEGDAKIFQSSAIGSLLRTILGIGLIGVGGVAIAGGVLPDKKPKKRAARPGEKLSSGQRVGLMMFGGAMAIAGLFLAGASLFFPSKLHVTVYPDRARMASTYSQTGGREVEVPFAGLASVELRDERSVMGKSRRYLVFTQTNGNIIRQDAGNNERKALETIQRALTEFAGQNSNENSAASAAESSLVADGMQSPMTSPASRSNEPAGTDAVGDGGVGAGGLGTGGTGVSEPGPPATPPAFTINGIVRPPSSGATESTTPAASQQYALKRYEITIPVPAGYSVVGPDTVVEVGRKLKACYAGSWSTVTVVAVNSDGTLSCNWDSYPSFTYKMMREDLTMAR